MKNLPYMSELAPLQNLPNISELTSSERYIVHCFVCYRIHAAFIKNSLLE